MQSPSTPPLPTRLQQATTLTTRKSPRSRTKVEPQFDWEVIDWEEGGKRKYQEYKAEVHEAFKDVCHVLKDDYHQIVKFFSDGPRKDGSDW